MIAPPSHFKMEILIYCKVEMDNSGMSFYIQGIFVHVYYESETVHILWPDLTADMALRTNKITCSYLVGLLQD